MFRHVHCAASDRRKCASGSFRDLISLSAAQAARSSELFISEVTALTLEAFAERVAKLEEYVSTQVTPRFDDIENGHKALFGRIDLYFAELRTQLNNERADLEAQLRKEHTVLSDDLNK